LHENISLSFHLTIQDTTLINHTGWLSLLLGYLPPEVFRHALNAPNMR